MIAAESTITSTTSPSSRVSNSSDGNKLTSPNTSRKNNGTHDNKSSTGKVEKLVNEFQQTYTENKETHYGIPDPASTSPQYRRQHRENTSSTSRQESHRFIPKYNNSNRKLRGGKGYHKRSLKRKNTNNNKTNPPLNKTIDLPDDSPKPGHVDIQQQFFKSLTNDLIKTVGPKSLKPPSNNHLIPDPSITPAIKSEETEIDTFSSSSVTLSSSPPIVTLLLPKKTTYEDDKGFKRQISKTMEPGVVTRDLPPPSILSNSAPAHANSVFGAVNKSSTSPSSPRVVRSSGNNSNNSSPVFARKGSPIVVVTDLANVRAALNPVGLPLEGNSSAPSSPTSGTSPVFPKPLRPVNSLKHPTPPAQSAPISKSIVPEAFSAPSYETGKREEHRNGHLSSPTNRPIHQHSSAFIPPISLESSSSSSTTSNSTSAPPSPTSPTSPSENTWTACKPLINKDNVNSIAAEQRNKRHLLSRPMSTIGFVRCASKNSLESTSNTNFTQFYGTDSGSRSPSPFTPTSISSCAPASPTISRVPTSPLASAPIPTGSTSSSTIASSPGSVSSFTGTSPSSMTSGSSSASTSPFTSSFDLKAIATASQPPSVDSIRPLINALAIAHNSRRSVESISSFSPHESPCESPCESPRPSSENPREFANESPRGFTEDGASVIGWRSPTLSASGGNNAQSPVYRVARASMYNHHRLNRGNTSLELSLSPRASPENLPSPNNNGQLRGRLDSGGRSHAATDAIGRPREGSAGSNLSPVRSISEPFVADNKTRSSSFGKEDSGQSHSSSVVNSIENIKAKNLLTRSVSAWQLGKNNEYGEEGESFSENRSDLLFTHTRTGMKVVKGGTLNALIEVLTWQKQSDPAYVDAFLLTYASFMTSTELLDKLIERYNQSPPFGLTRAEKEEFESDLLVVRLKVCSVLKSWVDKYYYDFQKDSLLVEKFIAFMESLKDRGMEKVAGMIVRALHKKLDGSGKKIIATPINRVPSPVIPKGEPTLLNFDDAEIARQLTLMEYESYCSIRPRECLNQSWNKANKEEESPNIVTMIRRSNIIPLWVATEIIKEDKLQRRTSLLKKFISIAEHCRQLNNFNGVMEIVSGLNLTPVYRLRKTWDSLPKKYVALFEQLTALMAPKHNFKIYREELHTKDPPCVPFLGVYLTDLTFIEELEADLGEGMINFITRMQLSVVIREIQQYQQTPYNLAFVPCIRDYLLKIFGFPEGELYIQSRMIEPPQASN